jgi:hypothetical protein
MLFSKCETWILSKINVLAVVLPETRTWNLRKQTKNTIANCADWSSCKRVSNSINTIQWKLHSFFCFTFEKGSGKGTQALKIERDFGPIPISTGHLLRTAAMGNSDFALRLREILERGGINFTNFSWIVWSWIELLFICRVSSWWYRVCNCQRGTDN